MSVVIVGGNECMVRQYLDLCREFRCRGKVFCKMHDGLKHQVGEPDLMVLFTGTTSHKMVRCALSGIKGKTTTVARSHSSSMTALRRILEQHTTQEEGTCPKN